MKGKRTLIALFEDSVKNFGENPISWEKENDTYTATTYKELYKEINYFAAGLLALGLIKGNKVALIAEGQKKWLISELGILFTGAINVPISIKTNELSDLRFRLQHSECRFVIK